MPIRDTDKEALDIIRKYMSLAYFSETLELSLEARSMDGETILHKAIFNRNLSDVRILIDAGASIEAVGDMGYTPLHEAVEFGNEEIVRVVIKAGASLT